MVVVGLKDEQWGRRVHAIVEPSDPGNPPSEADVIAFAKQRLAAYKVPKTVEFVVRRPPQRRHQGEPRATGRRTGRLIRPGAANAAGISGSGA